MSVTLQGFPNLHFSQTCYIKYMSDDLKPLPALFFLTVEELIQRPTNTEVSTPAPVSKEPSVGREHPVTQVAPPVDAPAAVVENVDLSKIGSILSSLNSVIKNTGECWWVVGQNKN